VNNNEDVDIKEQIGSEFQHGIVIVHTLYMYGTIKASRQVKFCDVDNFKKCIYMVEIDIRIRIRVEIVGGGATKARLLYIKLFPPTIII